MIINEEGTYTLKYTATDECGKSSTVDRELVVTDNSPRRTVLYTDGTFIINEKQTDEAHNIDLHGAATNVYDPLDANHNYVFSSQEYRPWHNQRTSILSVEIGSNIHPTSTALWFMGFTACTSINLTNLDTSLVTDMKYMFNNCSALSSLDVSGFDTSLVTDMKYMFKTCSALSSLDVSGFNTSLVTDMRNMFGWCRALSSLDVSGFNTSKVTNMSYMFDTCEALTSLDASNFVTNLVTDMNNMFHGCKVLTSLDVSNFVTNLVTDMNNMFSSCRALASLDLSNFVTSSVTNMSSMFAYGKLLTTIYASSNFVVTQVTSSTSMFSDMSTNLIGGAGTVWASGNPKDKTYAHIDGGTSNPGYFTAKS